MADTAERANSVFITGLKNAHALENQALELMNRQVERIENYPDIKAKLQQHIEETHNQIARLERILESLGESRSNSEGQRPVTDRESGRDCARLHAG